MSNNFEIPSEILDEIQMNITNIIESFDIPDSNKNEVIQKINFIYSRTKQMTITDALTTLYNRRYFETCFEREYQRSKRYGTNLSLAVIDIDFFKKFNDTYGHLCGDYVLQELAYIMVNNFRQTDILFRYGGEEFVVILTETTLENAFVPMERLRKAVENHLFKYKDAEFKVTISIGVADGEDMFEKADKALYEVKASGRNAVKLWEKL